MDSIKDIIFDAVELEADLREETKAWALPLLRGAEAVEALFGKVKTTVATGEEQAKPTVSAFDKPNWPDNKATTFTAPQIPYLAQGAVLPANKPFLAMVGDQKHGTNVEAPLTTIQEAVALVMDDQIGAITAGFEETVRVQREILEAVLGISIGDEVIANANDRYRRKMAVARGGVL